MNYKIRELANNIIAQPKTTPTTPTITPSYPQLFDYGTLCLKKQLILLTLRIC